MSIDLEKKMGRAVHVADTLGLRLYLRKEGVEVVSRIGMESWHQIVPWAIVEKSDDAMVCEIEMMAKGVAERRAEFARAL